ncbi:MAG: uroporphyrinogen decarboxylase family protein [Thermoguttaceae bacterium]
MTGYERVKAMLEGSPIDSLPYTPITMMFASDQLGVAYGRYAADFQTLVAGQLLVAEKFGFDHVSCISDPAREAADCGAQIHFFDDQPPAIDESNALLAEKKRLETLEVPDPFQPGSRMFDRVQAAALFNQKVKGKYWIEGWIEGPCAEGADLRGINALMLDFIDDPAFVHRLFDFCVQMGLQFAQAQIDAGCDIIGLGDAAASLVGPKIYKEFVLPYEKRLVDGIHAKGGRVRLHICGNISRSLAEIGSLGCDYYDLDYMVPLASAREKMGEKQVLSSNIDPVKVLRNGTPELIRQTLSNCFADLGPKMIVAAGCEVPRDTPLENLAVMHDFAKNA